MEAVTPQQQEQFEDARRVALTQAADGLLVLLNKTSWALLAFAIRCCATTQGRTPEDVGYIGVWLVTLEDATMLVPLRLELRIDAVNARTARLELAARLMAADKPYDVAESQLLAHSRATVHASRAQGLDAQSLYTQSLRLLQSFSPEQLATAVNEALAR